MASTPQKNSDQVELMILADQLNEAIQLLCLSMLAVIVRKPEIINWRCPAGDVQEFSMRDEEREHENLSLLKMGNGSKKLLVKLLMVGGDHSTLKSTVGKQRFSPSRTFMMALFCPQGWGRLCKHTAQQVEPVQQGRERGQRNTADKIELTMVQILLAKYTTNSVPTNEAANMPPPARVLPLPNQYTEKTKKIIVPVSDAPVKYKKTLSG
ncbi:hypothetical protein BJ742DRAFT_869666 [Cladochytrium replicatum]|nr:hypothetical protein BJ742DRAFT_869666 [Cladochytrium replicatum]